jgi:hypothetical protein
MITDKLTQAVAEAYKKMKQEELKGDQHKIDANKNGKIDAHDFKLLRAKNEETEPKSEKEKDLAALGHPKDKITHKDVLIGRGVLKQEEASPAPEGMKFVAAYDYKGTKHKYYRKGNKMTDPIVVHINGKEWKQFGSLKKAEDETIKHIKTMGESWDSKKPAVSEANVEETELQEGKMAQLHADIEDAVGQHVKDYNSGKLGHDSFGEKVVAAHQKIAKLHGIEPKHAKKFVNDYVVQNMKEEFQLDEGTKSGDDSLHDWFSKSKSSDGKPGWVQLGGKYAGKPCAKQPGQTTKPKCGSSKMKRDLSKDEEDAAFRRKNEKDPNPERSGKAKMVATEEKDACYHKVKARYKIWPSAYASGALVKCRKAGADNWGNKSEEVEVNEMDKTQRPPVSVGDMVHVGHSQKGGTGYRGKVHRIDGEHVYVNLGKEKFGDRIVKGLKKNVTKEEFDLNEGNDDVGEMIKDKLKIIINRAKEMHDGIGPNTDMPEWVKSKITLAQDYVSTACDYSCGSEQLGEEVNEGLLGSIAKGVAINVLGKMAANALMKKDDKKKKDQVDERCWDGYKPVKGKEAYSKGSCTKEEFELNEKAVSAAQQRFFGTVRAVQKGEIEAPSPEIAKAAAGMTKKAVKDYASTKHAGLPTRVIKDEVELDEDLKQQGLWKLITDHEKQAKKTKNVIKQNHHLAMADRYRGQLKTNDYDSPKVQEEEVELDEVSKSTLGSYIKKASHDVATKSALTRAFANKSAAEKEKENFMQARKDDEKSNQMFAKSWKRRQGIAKATDRLTKEESELSEDMGDPDIKVRQTYTKAYADHYKRALRLNPKGASKRAEVMAYDTVKMKHGDDAHDTLKAYHEKNQNESYEQIDEELSSRAKLVKELYNKAKEVKKSKKDVFEADPEMQIMPSPQYSQPKK